MTEQEKQEKITQNVGALECPSDVPGLVSSMITIPVMIDGVQMTACIGTRAAANVCTREEAYKVYMSGEVIFREGAKELLSLMAFGGGKVHIEETFFAARVKAFGTTFDQLFFIVDSDQQHMLLGLPALIQAQLCLLMLDGMDLMPSLIKIFNLDVDSDWGAARMKLTKQLNSTAVKLRMERIDSTVPEFDPYNSLKFADFGPARTDGTVL